MLQLDYRLGSTIWPVKRSKSTEGKDSKEGEELASLQGPVVET